MIFEKIINFWTNTGRVVPEIFDKVPVYVLSSILAIFYIFFTPMHQLQPIVDLLSSFLFDWLSFDSSSVRMEAVVSYHCKESERKGWDIVLVELSFTILEYASPQVL